MLDHNHGDYIRELRERAGEIDHPHLTLPQPPGIYDRPDIEATRLTATYLLNS